MKQSAGQQQAQRQLMMALVVVSMFMFLTRQKPPEKAAGAPSPAVADQGDDQPLPAAQVAKLRAKGAPPYVEDLRLQDPAWVALGPRDAANAIAVRLKNAGKDDPRVPRWILTQAYLLETVKDGGLEAAAVYSGLGRYLTPAPGSSGGQAAYRYAGQAKLRAADLYLAAAAAQKDTTFRSKAKKELEMVTTQLQRFGPQAVTLWSWTGQSWEPVEDPYGYVLERTDQLTRDTPMYQVLDHLVLATGGRHGWNMVLALILLAVVLKLAMHPLSRKSYRSMSAMQRMQPVMDELRKKYKDQPKKLNEEMMRLYSEQGINPLGGCLPMVLQIPVFIFVYSGIRAYTFRFHHVQFLWIKSLAGPDLALLVVYGLSMFVTQWLMMKRQPKPADPASAQTQQMMAWLMPIMFTYMMYVWKLPSAFYLYWLTFNVLSTTEQMIIHGERARDDTPAPVLSFEELREQATRKQPGPRTTRAGARKKGGSGRRGG